MDMLATRREPELAVAVWLMETTRSHQTGGDSRPPSGWTKYCSTVSPDRLNNSSSWPGHLLQTHEGPYLSRGAAPTRVLGQPPIYGISEPDSCLELRLQSTVLDAQRPHAVTTA